MYLTKERKEDIFTKFGGAPENTGSIEGQIALFTFRIEQLSEHLKKNRNDHSCRRSLLKLVGKRKSLLNYLMKQNIQEYRALIEKLNIRK
ncbi:MAG: 30S ribosomal protein S15 [Saprospiraceae bacterium]|nr:30S ribosomal protein S15 [Saprospiraceae bacterium]